MKRLSLFLLSAICFISLGLSAQAPPLGQVVVTHVFDGPGDSPDPQYGLIELPNGNFAGVTQGNHANNLSSRMVYEMTPMGVVTPLVRFGPRVTQLRINGDVGGSYQLLQASDGNFYAVASSAGPTRSGNLYNLTPAGAYSVGYVFSESARVGLAESLDGGLYGFGADPSKLENGIYRFDPVSGQVVFVYEATPFFANGTPVFGNDGNIYGLNETLLRGADLADPSERRQLLRRDLAARRHSTAVPVQPTRGRPDDVPDSRERGSKCLQPASAGFHWVFSGTNGSGETATGSPGTAFVLNLGLPKPLPSIRGFAPSRDRSGPA